jgi:hypothetical protein
VGVEGGGEYWVQDYQGDLRVLVSLWWLFKRLWRWIVRHPESLLDCELWLLRRPSLQMLDYYST